ncbi:MAG: hypothetical protein ACYTGC_04075, partial [Planctomycetota bacterium]
MSPKARRIIIPLVVAGLGVGTVLSVVFREPPTSSGEGGPGLVEPPADEPAPNTATGTTGTSGTSDQTPTGEQTPLDAPDEEPSPTAVEQEGQRPAEEPLGDLHAASAPGPDRPDLLTIGSLNPAEARMLLELTSRGAGISRITLSDQWHTVRARQQADAHYRALNGGDPDPPPLPDDAMRYVLTETHDLGALSIPVMAAQSIEIDGIAVDLLFDEAGQPVDWTATDLGVMTVDILDEQDRAVARVRREFVLGENGDITLRQRIDNLLARPITVKWLQWGPNDLIPDRARYMDRRRFRFGYLYPPERDPSRQLVFADPGMLIERADVVKADDFLLWPNDTSRSRGYELSWFASTNRYFALVIHPVLDDLEQSPRKMTDVVASIGHVTTTREPKTAVVFTQLFSPARTIEPGGSTAFDLGVYAGPQDRSILGRIEPFVALRMQELILFQMSSCCAICTFQWLADLLIQFLSFVERIVGDWGISIIFLVCVVRAMLHPLTKRAQINMHRFSHAMTSMKPELER